MSPPNLPEIEQSAAELKRFGRWEFGGSSPSWNWPEVYFHNSATSAVPSCTSIRIRAKRGRLIDYLTNFNASLSQGCKSGFKSLLLGFFIKKLKKLQKSKF